MRGIITLANGEYWNGKADRFVKDENFLMAVCDDRLVAIVPLKDVAFARICESKQITMEEEYGT